MLLLLFLLCLLLLLWADLAIVGVAAAVAVTATVAVAVGGGFVDDDFGALCKQASTTKVCVNRQYVHPNLVIAIEDSSLFVPKVPKGKNTMQTENRNPNIPLSAGGCEELAAFGCG